MHTVLPDLLLLRSSRVHTAHTYVLVGVHEHLFGPQRYSLTLAAHLCRWIVVIEHLVVLAANIVGARHPPDGLGRDGLSNTFVGQGTFPWCGTWSASKIKEEGCVLSAS